MKILTTIFLVLFLCMFLFAKVKYNGEYDISIIERIIACIIGSLIITLIFGLPILGVLYLLGL